MTHGWDEIFCLGAQTHSGGGGFKLPTELWRRLLSIGRIGTRTGADFLFFAHVYISPRNILRRFDDYVPEVRPGQSSHIDGGYNA